MNFHLHHARAQTRREFLGHAGKLGLGAFALQSLMNEGFAAGANPLSPKASPLPSKIKSVIYLSMSGAPPQLDMFDWKPELVKHHMQDCPEASLKRQSFASSTGTTK